MLVTGGRLPSAVILQVDIPDEELRKRLGKKADNGFEQLLKGHREIDMFSVYFPAATCDPRTWSRQTCAGEQAWKTPFRPLFL